MSAESPVEVGLLNYGRILRLSAEKFPSNSVLEYAGRQYEYRRFNREVNGVAAALVEDGVATGDRVIVLSANTPNYVRLMFALGKIGALPVPLNTMLARDSIRGIIASVSPNAAYISADYSDAFAEANESPDPSRSTRVFRLPEDLGADTATRSAIGNAVATTTEPVPTNVVRDDDPAIILFSSGSTATPSGVVKSFSNLAWSAINRQIAEPRRPGDREYFCLPLAGIAFANFVLTDVLTGTTCVLARQFSAQQAADDLAHNGITHVFLAPTMIRAIAEAYPDRAYPGVQRVECSFEFPIELRRTAVEMFPNATILWSFGSTEATMARTPPEQFLNDPTCVGFASGLDEYRVVPAGGLDTVGEVESRGPTRMLCYLDDLGGLARAAPEEWFATGDLGQIDAEGRLHFRGRTKDMIKSGGANVFARDVELALLAHAAIHDAAVVGLPDPYWGEAVIALVELVPDVPAGSLLSHLRKHLAGFQLPQRIYATERIPINPTGKVAKGRVREMIVSGEVALIEDRSRRAGKSSVEAGPGSAPATAD